MNEIIVATKNRGKARDFIGMFEPLGLTVKTLNDYEEIEDVEETGTTFEENAVIKAETVAKRLGRIVIADDSGLIVDALNGEPGIYSARYAGEQKDDEANIDKVLQKLKGVPDNERTARYYCALALAFPDGRTTTVNGTCEGVILHERRGNNGFGYDPIFYMSEMDKTMAEITLEEKNQISHRAEAMRKLKDILPALIGAGAQ